MKCVVCERKFDNCEDEDVCPLCKRIASEKTIEFFREKRRFEKNSGGKK